MTQSVISLASLNWHLSPHVSPSESWCRYRLPIPYLGEKNREGVLSAPFSIKARALIHAALSRTELNPTTLGKDRDYILKKTPQLLREMIQCCVNTIVAMRHQGELVCEYNWLDLWWTWHAQESKFFEWLYLQYGGIEVQVHSDQNCRL